LLSWSKKNLASARRGRTTRSLPDHGAGIGRVDVADHQKPVGHLPGIEQRKVLLVGLHGEDQALLRAPRETAPRSCTDTAHWAARPAPSPRPAGPRRATPAAPPTFAAAAERALSHDLGLALGKAGDDGAVFRQRGRVLIGVFQVNWIGTGWLRNGGHGCVAGGQAQRLAPVPPCCHAGPPGRAPGAQKFTLLQPGSSQSDSSW
jgi:hypothetical protein